MQTFDAILVPGGGLDEDGAPSPWVRNRLDRAIQRRTTEVIIVLSAGTIHKPPLLDEKGFPIFESVASARYLVQRGAPSAAVLYETVSYDTVGNAFFARLVHTQPLELRRLLVITSVFHMARTQFIFRKVFGLSDSGYSLTFETVPDVGMDERSLAARRRKEQDSLERFMHASESITSIRQLHEWLFLSHPAYQIEKMSSAIGDAINTY